MHREVIIEQVDARVGVQHVVSGQPEQAAVRIESWSRNTITRWYWCHSKFHKKLVQPCEREEVINTLTKCRHITLVNVMNNYWQMCCKSSLIKLTLCTTAIKLPTTYLSNSDMNSLNSPPPSMPASSAPAWFTSCTRSFNFRFGSGIKYRQYYTGCYIICDWLMVKLDNSSVVSSVSSCHSSGR